MYKIAKIVIAMLLCLLCSCATERDNSIDHSSSKEYCMIVSSEEKTLMDLATTTYSGVELLDIINYNGSMDELDSMYPMECVRSINNGYRVSYVGDDSVATIVFDKSGNKISGKVYTLEHTKNKFDTLTKGHSLDDVKKISPYGEYLFLYTGRNDSPRLSSHFTRDGYLITVEYDEKHQIINVSSELI